MKLSCNTNLCASQVILYRATSVILKLNMLNNYMKFEV